MIAAMPFLRTAYNYDVNAASDESGLACEDPSLADQSQAEDCDINTIVRRFGLTGEMPGTLRTPLQGDFTTVTDFQGALEMIMEAEEAFMTLPAAVRAKFENDAGRFVEFASNPENVGAMKEMGLAKIENPRAPVEVRVVADPPADSTVIT